MPQSVYNPYFLNWIYNQSGNAPWSPPPALPGNQMSSWTDYVQSFTNQPQGTNVPNVPENAPGGGAIAPPGSSGPDAFSTLLMQYLNDPSGFLASNTTPVPAINNAMPLPTSDATPPPSMEPPGTPAPPWQEPTAQDLSSTPAPTPPDTQVILNQPQTATDPTSVGELSPSASPSPTATPAPNPYVVTDSTTTTPGTNIINSIASIPGLLASIPSDILSTLSNITDPTQIANFIQSLPSNIVSTLQNVPGMVGNVASSVINAPSNLFQTLSNLTNPSAIGNTLQNVTGDITSLVGKLPASLLNILGNVVGGIPNFLGNIVSLPGAYTPVATNPWSNLPVGASIPGETIPQGVYSGLGNPLVAPGGIPFSNQQGGPSTLGSFGGILGNQYLTHLLKFGPMDEAQWKAVQEQSAGPAVFANKPQTYAEYLAGARNAINILQNTGWTPQGGPSVGPEGTSYGGYTGRGAGKSTS